MRHLIVMAAFLFHPISASAQQINAHNFGHSQIINILTPDVGLKFASQPYVVSSLAKFPILADPTAPQWLGSRSSTMVDGVAAEAAYKDFLKGKRIIEDTEGIGKPSAVSDDDGKLDSQVGRLAAASKALDNSIAQYPSGWAHLYRGIARSQLRAFGLANQDFLAAEKLLSHETQFQTPLQVAREFARATRSWAAGANARVRLVPLLGACPDTPDKSRAVLGGDMGICSLLFCGQGEETRKEDRFKKIVPVLRDTLDALKTSDGSKAKRDVVYACAAYITGLEDDLQADIDRLLLAFAAPRHDKDEFLKRFSSLESLYLRQGRMDDFLALLEAHAPMLKESVPLQVLYFRYAIKGEVGVPRLRQVLAALGAPDDQREAYVALKSASRNLGEHVQLLSEQSMVELKRRMGNKSRLMRLISTGDLMSFVQALFTVENGDVEAELESMIAEAPGFLSNLAEVVTIHAQVPERLAAIEAYEKALLHVLDLPGGNPAFRELDRQLTELDQELFLALANSPASAEASEMIELLRHMRPYGRYLMRTLIAEALLNSDMQSVESLGRFLADKPLHHSFIELLEGSTKGGIPDDKMRGLLVEVLTGLGSHIPVDQQEWLTLIPADAWVRLGYCGSAWLRDPSVMRSPSGSCVRPTMAAIDQMIRSYLRGGDYLSPSLLHVVNQLLDVGGRSARQQVAKGDSVFTAWAKGMREAFARPTAMPGWKALASDDRLMLHLLATFAEGKWDQNSKRRHMSAMMAEIERAPQSHASQVVGYLIFFMANQSLPQAEAAIIGRKLYGGDRLAAISMPVVRAALLTDPAFIKTMDANTLAAVLDSSAASHFHGNDKIVQLVASLAIVRGVSPLDTPFSPAQVDVLSQRASWGRKVVYYGIPLGHGFEDLASDVSPYVIDNLPAGSSNDWKMNFTKSGNSDLIQPYEYLSKVDVPGNSHELMLLQVVAGAKAADWPRVRGMLHAVYGEFQRVNVADDNAKANKRHAGVLFGRLTTFCASIFLQRKPAEDIADFCQGVLSNYLEYEGDAETATWAVSALMRADLRERAPASKKMEEFIAGRLFRLTYDPDLKNSVKSLSAKTFLANAREYAKRNHSSEILEGLRLVRERTHPDPILGRDH